MDDYWSLFWATGMPEAWAMNRQMESGGVPDGVLHPDAAMMPHPPVLPVREMEAAKRAAHRKSGRE